MKRASFVLALLAVLLVLACTNDPFDPESVPNARPVMSFFAVPVDPDDDLNDTSYFERTFHWSGSDEDGEVVEYHVAIATDTLAALQWDTTTATDTTLSFTPDDEGFIDARFHLACRDDRGALSDTLVRRVPMRNFPPIVNFQSDYEPEVNWQREIDYATDPPETTYWNWGNMNIRCFAFDLDGNSTMDDFYRYTASDTEPTETRDWDDPTADIMQHWLRRPFESVADIIKFELVVAGLAPGQRTVTIAVGDEADTETRVTLSWEVREPRGRVLVIPDGAVAAQRNFYDAVFDEILGAGQYDEYVFWRGFPDSPGQLLATFRLFDLVFWYDNIQTSPWLERAAHPSGVLRQYLEPLDDSEPGQLVLVSRNLTGTQSQAQLPNPFRRLVLGINRSTDPNQQLQPIDPTLPALGGGSHLPTIHLDGRDGRGRGLMPADSDTTTYEELYRFQACDSCWRGQAGTEWAPLIGIRHPRRSVQRFASAVAFSFDLHEMNQAEVTEAMRAIFTHELGVISP